MVRLAFLLLFLAYSLSGSSLAQANECKITFAVSNNFPPYQMEDEQGQWVGIVVDLARTMVTKAGCDFEIVNLPWKRAMDYVTNGELQMLPLVTANLEREEFFHFIGPMALERIVFVAQERFASDVSRPEDLKTFPALIGKTQGTRYSDKIEELVKHPSVKAKMVRNFSDANKLEMLLKNRLGGAFEEQTVAEYYFYYDILDPEEYEICLSFLPNPIYFGVTKVGMSPVTLAALRNAWRNMLKQGDVNVIFKKYGVSMPDLTNLDFPQY